LSSPLRRHQVRRLEQLRALALCSDEAMAARISEVGEPCSRTALCHYRSGKRTAPLGMLDLILGFVDDPAEVLALWARDYGLQVLPAATAADIDTDERGLADRALELGDQVGDIHRAVREALADGAVDDEERARIYHRAKAAAESIAELVALTAPLQVTVRPVTIQRPITLDGPQDAVRPTIRPINKQ
jgi:hypothetical protein